MLLQSIKASYSNKVLSISDAFENLLVEYGLSWLPFGVMLRLVNQLQSRIVFLYLRAGAVFNSAIHKS